MVYEPDLFSTAGLGEVYSVRCLMDATFFVFHPQDGFLKNVFDIQ